jgi:hypothetical protein
MAQKSRERERKKVIGVKLKVYYIHVPPLHDRDTEMNIKTSKNDVFGYLNQLHVMMEQMSRAQHEREREREREFFFQILLIY